MTVQEAMTRGVHAIDSQASLQEAAAQMREHGIGWLPVRRDGKVAGVISDRDIVVRGLAERLDPAKALVGDVLSEGPVACHANDGVDQAARLMRGNKVRRLLVLDEAGNLLGVLSVGDLAARAPDRGLAGGVVARVCRE